MSNTRHPMLVLCSQIRSLFDWHGGWGGVIGTAITRTLLVGLMLCVEKRGGAVKAATPPNVVLIVADDQHWGDYGFMGHPHLRTPHLDRLARESLVFRRGYVPSSLYCPSLASLITGCSSGISRIC